MSVGLNPGRLLDHAPYTPFMDSRTAHAPGLSPLDPSDWLPVGPDFAEQMAYREDLLQRAPHIVLAMQSGSDAAVLEMLEAVLAHLAGRPDYSSTGDFLTRPDGGPVEIKRSEPLETLTRLCPADFCLLAPDAVSGEYRLIAATLCFPSRWLLSEKLGKPLTAIHDPVPDYDDTLARRVNRVFEVLRVERPLVRINWLVHATPELHLPLGLSDKLVSEADPSDGLYLRTERQTLHRLARSKAVVFGIKTTLCPLDVLDRAQADALARELARLDPDTIAYRSGANLHKAALARLEELAR